MNSSSPVTVVAKATTQRREKLLIPGWAGELFPDELAYIQRCLKESPRLAHRRGFTPGGRNRSMAAVSRVAIWGDPDHRQINVDLVRSSNNTVGKSKS